LVVVCLALQRRTMGNRKSPISRDSATHYKWVEVCDAFSHS